MNRDRLLIPSENRGKDPVSPTTPAAAQAPATGAFLPAKFGSSSFLSYLCTETSKRREKNKPQQPQQRPAHGDAPLVKSKQEESADGKSEGKKDELAIEFGKFCLDLAKLTFGGVFLAAIMEMSYDMSKAVSLGAVAIVLLSILGFIFIKIGNKK